VSVANADIAIQKNKVILEPVHVQAMSSIAAENIKINLTDGMVE